MAESELIPGLEMTKEEWYQKDTEERADLIRNMQKGRLARLYNRDFESKEEVVEWSLRSKCYGNFEDEKRCIPAPEVKSKEEMKEIFKNIDLERVQDPQERVNEWYNNIWPQEDEKNFPYPYLATTGLDQVERMRFSRVIHLATQPGEKFKYKETEEPAHCALFVHQTNEREIMDDVGSRRMNSHLKTLRYTDLEEKREDEQVVQHFYDDLTDQKARMKKCEKRHESLSLEDAYFFGSGMSIHDVNSATAVATLLRDKYARQSPLDLPAFSCRQPILGVPFAEYFVDGVDVPECSLEMLKSINGCLKRYGVQMIDLRMRVENRPGRVVYVDPVQTPQSAIQAVVNCLELLNDIRNTARYFVVYSFVLKDCPVHFYQMIIRFTPGMPIDPIDFVDDGIARRKLKQPPSASRRHEADNYFYKNFIAGQLSVMNMKTALKIVAQMSVEDIEILRNLLELCVEKKEDYDRSLKTPEEEPEEEKQEGILKKLWRKATESPQKN
ncbi:hypothetical protein CAEBREN_23957 [Caenorhabditis brenneri]|uniref:Uncharacterized protein n=1 Tax=Caenorhabditis brenneri TaxID=135651 RepID=G0MWC6_CAEBE|nr:hypothetical protein CAEBREN_23957 [Caenorhabditis brenneri]